MTNTIRPRSHTDTIVKSEKVRGLKAFFAATPNAAIRTALRKALNGKAVFTFNTVYTDYRFNFSREGTQWEVIQLDENGELAKAATFDMPTQDSLHAGNMKAWDFADKSFTLPEGTWVINTGDWYVNHAVTVYKVIAAPPSPKPLDEFVLEGFRREQMWTESRLPAQAVSDYTTVIEVGNSVYNWRFMLRYSPTTNKIGFDSMPHPGMKVDEVKVYYEALGELLRYIRVAEIWLNSLVALAPNVPLSEAQKIVKELGNMHSHEINS